MEANNGSNTLHENGMVSKFGHFGNSSDKTLGAATRVYSAHKIEEKCVEKARLVVSDRAASDEKECDWSQQDDFISDANKKVPVKGITSSVEVFGPPNGVEKANKQVFREHLEIGKSFEYEKVEIPSSKVSQKEDGMALGDTDKFLVGDLVWVLTKTKSWWPGQIIDPSLLSNIAPKPDKNASLFVNYIGNKPTVWCSPKNLKPFMENFKHMSSQGKSRVFLSAVQKALDLYGNGIKAQMTCPVENETSAIKEETFFPNKNALSEFEPMDFLHLVKTLAWCESNPEILELAKVKSHLSAFYRSLGHYQLPMRQLHETTNGNKHSAKRGNNSGLKGVDGNKDSEAIDSDKVPFLYSEVNSEKVFGSRERKRSKYLSYPFIDLNEPSANLPETNDMAVSISLVNPRNRSYMTKLQKLAYQPKAPITPDDLDTPSVDLLSKLRFAALDCDVPSKERDFDLVDRFFYGLRSWTFHDKYGIEMEHKHEDDEKTKDDPKSPKRVGNKPHSSKSNNVNTPKRKRKKGEISTSSKGKSAPTSGVCGVNKASEVEMALPNLNGNCIMQSPTVVNSPENNISACLYNVETVSGNSIPEVKKVKRNRKAPKTGQSTIIPDLNGNDNVSETGSQAKVFPETNSAQNEAKKRRRRNKIASPQASLNPLFSNVFMNGVSLGTALVLTFAEGFPVPSKEALIATFCGFGPLNDSETKGLSDNRSAQVVFRKGSDAVEALKGVEKRSPFGPVLIQYRLQHLLPAPKPIRLKPCELKVVNMPKDAVDLAYMRKNLERMTSVLEKEGNHLSTDMREKLENEIKGLLKKVNAMVGSTSSS